MQGGYTSVSAKTMRSKHTAARDELKHQEIPWSPTQRQVNVLLVAEGSVPHAAWRGSPPHSLAAAAGGATTGV
jgi:hypothetical protein